MSDSNVVPFSKTSDVANSVDVKTTLTTSLAQSVEKFEERVGHPPTIGVWVLMDDEGRNHVGWDSTLSPLPANGAVGIALSSITRHLGQD